PLGLDGRLAYGTRLNATDAFASERHQVSVQAALTGSYLPKFEIVGGLICYGYSAARRMAGASLAERALSDSAASLFNDDLALLNAEEWLLQADYAATKHSPVQEQAEKRRDQIKCVLTGILPDVGDIEFTQPSEKRPRPGVRVKT